MSTPRFALIDCDNFFVSCERLFRPDLTHQPVVVLSSNDGCVVSRSREAKALGIPMGAPAFQYRTFFQEHRIVQFSANFELYGDISKRLLDCLLALTPRVEAYSVDEAFIDLDELPVSNWQEWGSVIRRRILRDIGVPVSIGIAPTKTLAKLAASQAKHLPILRGVLALQPETTTGYLQNTAIEDIWGIGRRLTPKLKAAGIYSAYDVQQLRPRYAKQLLGSIHGRQLVAELSGQSCYPIELAARQRQSIMHGRMFGEDTDRTGVIEAAIVSLTNKAAMGLRREGLLAQRAAIVLSTNRHKPGYRRVVRSFELDPPTTDGGQIAARLVHTLAPDLSAHTPYHRVNVLLDGLLPEHSLQADLFRQRLPAIQATRRRLGAIDRINAKYGPRTIRSAAEDLSSAWQPKRAWRSPRYTTQWQELPLLSR